MHFPCIGAHAHQLQEVLGQRVPYVHLGMHDGLQTSLLTSTETGPEAFTSDPMEGTPS
jgi:hypothetical protein